MGKLENEIKFILRQISAYMSNPIFRRGARYARGLEKNKINENMIFYESFQGKGLLCNPYAIFKYILENDKRKKYIHVWALKDINSEIKEQYKNNRNVIFVELYSKKYFNYLSKAKYLINNVTFHSIFQKREDQIYINTWHGTPLKHLGNDENTAKIDAAKNMIRNMISSDYIINQNHFTTEAIISAFELNDVYKGEFIEEGYPRTDLILNTDKKGMINRIEDIIGTNVNKKLILYAPTWRGNTKNVVNNTAKMISDINELRNEVGEDYIILLKLHQLEYKYIGDLSNVKDIYSIPVEWDVNELLSVIDILITDYSSIFFDFLVTRKPILFYMYDKESYIDNRGTYIDVTQENFPGPISRNVNELIRDIKDIENVKKKYLENYNRCIEKYSANQDGKVTERIVNYIFNNEKNVITHKCYNQDKKHVLIYGGGFFNNGITTSLLNLLDKVDYTKYSITVVESDKADSRVYNLNRLNENVRILFRSSPINVTLLEKIFEHLAIRFGIDSKISKKIFPKNLYYREYRRLFGNLEFDIMIDFAGYSSFWDYILLNSKSKAKKYIYQHNNMIKEYEKRIGGKYKHKSNLDVIFKLYNKFDKVVSVSEATMKLNKDELSKFTSTDNFTYTNNLIGLKDIEEKLSNIKFLNIENKQYLVEEKYKSTGRYEIVLSPKLDEHYINIVTVGRLSPEKDHSKLIDAFYIITQKFNNMRLYIIGEGVLKEELESKIARLNLKDNVFLLGQISNPFYYIKNASAFVLSSNHEGQPMVLLEALALKQKVVATDIVANRGILKDGLGELVENSVDGLVKGITKIVNNNIVEYTFDPEEYNKFVFEQIEKEILN